MADPVRWNPQLPQAPQDPRIGSDPEYQLDIGDLYNNFIRDYHDTLQQLGYTDDQGNVIPGLVDIEAGKQRQAYQYAQDIAERGVTEAAQREGTLFSGRRGDQLAEAIHPYVTARATLEENLPRQLSGLLTHAQGLISGYGSGLSRAAINAIKRYVPPGVDPGPGPGPTDPGPPPGPTEPVNYTGGTTPYSPILPHGPVAETDLPAQPPFNNPAAAPTPPPAPKSTYNAKTANMLKGVGGFAYDQYIKNNPPPAKLAGGAVVDEPTNAIIGDAGPEAVVPLGGGIRDAIARLLLMEQQRRRQAIDPGFYHPLQRVDPRFTQGFPVNPDPGFRSDVGGFLPRQDPRVIVDRGFGGDPGSMFFPPERQAPQAQGQKLAPGRQVDQGPRVPNVKAVGLKAAARILNEAAKEHEHEALQGTPVRPPAQHIQHPPARGAGGIPGAHTFSPPVRRYAHTLGS